jgi:hypothetical protein
MSKDDDVSRRETLKLVTALSALGVGLGVTFREGEARAETHKIDRDAIGVLSLKFYRDNPGKPPELLHAIELNPAGLKIEPGRYSLKLTNRRQTAEEIVAEHFLEVTSSKT